MRIGNHIRNFYRKYKLYVISISVIIGLIFLIKAGLSSPVSSYQFSQEIDKIYRMEVVHKTVDTGSCEDPVEVLLTIENDFQPILDAVQALPGRRVGHDPAESVGDYQLRIYYYDGQIEIIGEQNNAYISVDGRITYDCYRFEGECFKQLLLSMI